MLWLAGDDVGLVLESSNEGGRPKEETRLISLWSERGFLEPTIMEVRVRGALGGVSRMYAVTVSMVGGWPLVSIMFVHAKL